MSKRKGISPKVRFEVFKRDSFKCQYCGRCAPEVVLEIEHIEPHSKGGSDEVLNLITSCWQCNSGKGDRRLNDDAVIKKQRDQLEELQERREQLDMMLRWRNDNLDLATKEVDAFLDAYRQRVSGWELNEKGAADARKLIKKYGFAKAITALDRAVDASLPITEKSVGKVLPLTFVFCEPEDIQALYLIRARIRHRWNYVHDGIAISLLRKVHKLGVSVEEIREQCERLMAERNTSFRWWQSEVEEWIETLQENT